MSLETVLELGKKKLGDLLAGKQEAEEVKKVEETKKAEEVAEPKQKTAEEIQTEEAADDSDEDLLDKPEDQLEEEEKTKVEEIKEKRKGEPTDKQLARKLKKAEKKISKMFGRLKDLERAKETGDTVHETEIASLKSEIAIATTPVVERNAVQAEEQRVLTEITEDKEKPYVERREMTKEDWETWNDEDPLAAQRWVAKNEQRRVSLQNESATKAEMAEKAEEFLAEQDKSVKRLTEKFPNVRPEAKVLELKEKGLSKSEVLDVLESEYPEYAICDQIVKENPKWMEAIDFGDKVAAELEIRLAGAKETKPTPKLYTEDEVAKIKEDALKSEADRRESVDESNSSTAAHVVTKPIGSKSDHLQKLEALFKKAGLDPAKAKANLDRRTEMGLGGIYDPSQDKD